MGSGYFLFLYLYLCFCFCLWILSLEYHNQNNGLAAAMVSCRFSSFRPVALVR